MLRASSYTIYVPLGDAKDEMLLVHGYTGAYDRVSRRVGEYVQSLEPAEVEKPLHGEWVTEPAAASPAVSLIAPSNATMEVLRRRGYVTDMSVDEETGYLARIAKQTHRIELMKTPTYIFMPTYNCNLRCAYCFQDHMRTNPAFKHLLRCMSQEVIDRIVASMPGIEQGHGLEPNPERYRDVGFFGGEPLLASNRPAVAYIIKRLKEAGPVGFWAVTNATELEAYEDLLGPDGIGSVQITIDGPPAEHDKRRIYANGAGSFAQIARNVDLCLDRGVNVQVRMNIDRSNIAELPRLAKAIIEHGWHERRGFSTYTAPITDGNASTTLVEIRERYFTSWELDQAVDELRALDPAMAVIGRPDDMLISRVRRLFDKNRGGTMLKASFCGAHTGMYIFDAFADVYACWERTGDPAVRIGRINDEGALELNAGMNRLWRTRTPASNPTCRKCRYAMNCGGGCAILAEARSGTMHSNHCDAFGERFRDAVKTAYGDFVVGRAAAESARVCDL